MSIIKIDVCRYDVYRYKLLMHIKIFSLETDIEKMFISFT